MKKRIKSNILGILLFIIIALGIVGSWSLFNPVVGTLIYILLIIAICLV